MSMRLDLPPERDLPAARHQEMRAELLRTTRPTPRRRSWVGVVAAAAAATVVVGLGVGLAHPSQETPALGVPTPVTTPSPSPTDRPTSGRDIDLGPLDQGEQSRAAAACAAAAEHSPKAAEVVFARHTAADGDVIFFIDQDRRLTVCFEAVRGATIAASPTGFSQPTSDKPVVRLTSLDLGASGDGVLHSRAAYAVGPEVSRLQLRIVVDGTPGSWFDASIHNGYAWAGATSTSHVNLDEVRTQVQDRAFDAAGDELPIDRTR